MWCTCKCVHTSKHTTTQTQWVSLSGWLQKPDRCDPVSLSTPETWPMGRQRPRCSNMGPKCTALCRGRARTDSRRWWHVSGRSITFRMRWSTSRRWVETNTTSSQAFWSTHHCFNILSYMQGFVGCWVDNICMFCVSVRRWEILWKRWESVCTGSLEECSNQCRSFHRKSG